MKTNKLAAVSVVMGFTFCGGQLLAPAQDEIEGVVRSPGQEKVTQKIAGDFDQMAGEHAESLVDSLRNGSDFTYDRDVEIEVEIPVFDVDGNPVYKVDDNGQQIVDVNGNPVQETRIEIESGSETVTIENTNGGMGFGNVKISLLLAEEMLKQNGFDGNIDNLSGALFGGNAELGTGVLEMRAAGAGWGEISQELLGVKMGTLMSAKNKKRIGSDGEAEIEKEPHAASEKGKSNGKGNNKSAKGNDRVAANEKQNKGQLAKAERAQSNKVNKVQRPNKVEKPSKPEKPAKPEKPQRPEKPEKPEKPQRPEKPEKPQRPGR